MLCWKTRTSRECQLSSKYLSVIRNNIKNIISLNVKVSVEKCLKYIHIKHVHVYLYTKKIWCKLLLLQGSFKAVTMPHCSVFLLVIVGGRKNIVCVAPTEHIKFDVMNNVWTQISGHVSIQLKPLVFAKYAVILCAYGTSWQNIIFFFYLQSSRAVFCSQAGTCRTLKTQTITILKRQIPSVEWSYWFPSENAQRRGLCRHESHSGWHHFTPILYFFIYTCLFTFDDSALIFNSRISM